MPLRTFLIFLRNRSICDTLLRRHNLAKSGGVARRLPKRRLMRYALSFGVAVALLAGCGGRYATMLPSNGAREVIIKSAVTQYDEYTDLFNFKGGEKGFNPFGALLYVGGMFYGTTVYGGSPECYGPGWGCGTFYSINAQGQQRILYHFKKPGAWEPGGGLIQVGGLIYGEAAGGTGRDLAGTVFEITKTGNEKTLYNFQPDGHRTDGFGPGGGLRYLNGRLFGVTDQGGADDYGTIFVLSLAGAERVLYSFKGDAAADGAEPRSELTNVNGTLYGTTSAGGGRDQEKCRQAFGNTCGTVFSITPAGQYRVLYRFGGGSDGAYPIAGLTYLDGELYGTTSFGGGAGSGCPAGCGTVFDVSPTSGEEHILYRFKGGADGSQPGTTLSAYRGVLYGSAYLGGTGSGCLISGGSGCGTLFKMTRSGTKTILYQFKHAGLPNSQLTEVGGNLYSTIPMGGPYCRAIFGCGEFFRLTL